MSQNILENGSLNNFFGVGGGVAGPYVFPANSGILGQDVRDSLQRSSR